MCLFFYAFYEKIVLKNLFFRDSMFISFCCRIDDSLYSVRAEKENKNGSS